MTVYYNYCNYKRRYELTRDFLATYPNVWVVEVSYTGKFEFNERPNTMQVIMDKPGFVNNMLINYFLEQKKEDLESLTFIDSDCKLYDGFFNSVETKLSNYIGSPAFIQPYSEIITLFESAGKFCRQNGLINCSKGRTGIAYTYSKEFLKLIDYKFPEFMLLGGFDTVLYACIMKNEVLFNNMLKCFKKKHKKELENFYEKTMNVKTDYIEGQIITYEHGLFENRKYTERFKLYKKLNDEIILTYFQGRKEDEYLH